MSVPAEKVKVIDIMRRSSVRAFVDGEGADIPLHIDVCRAHDALLTLLTDAARVVRSLRVDGFVKPSRKNPNSGFVDMRDWYALQPQINALANALARVGGDV